MYTQHKAFKQFNKSWMISLQKIRLKNANLYERVILLFCYKNSSQSYFIEYSTTKNINPAWIFIPLSVLLLLKCSVWLHAFYLLLLVTNPQKLCNYKWICSVVAANGDYATTGFVEIVTIKDHFYLPLLYYYLRLSLSQPLIFMVTLRSWVH